jgi:hypothetical protein
MLAHFVPGDPVEAREAIVRQIEIEGGYPIRWH